MQELEPNCRMNGTSHVARAEEERGRSWRPTRMSGGPEKRAAIQGVQPFCTPSECLVPLAQGEDVDSPHRGASTAESMLARPMPTRQHEEKRKRRTRSDAAAVPRAWRQHHSDGCGGAARRRGRLRVPGAGPAGRDGDGAPVVWRPIRAYRTPHPTRARRASEGRPWDDLGARTVHLTSLHFIASAPGRSPWDVKRNYSTPPTGTRQRSGAGCRPSGTRRTNGRA